MAASLRDLPRPYYRLEEYFALEQAGEARYEYWDGNVLCMSGGSREHATICSNVHFRLSQKLEATESPGFQPSAAAHATARSRSARAMGRMSSVGMGDSCHARARRGNARRGGRDPHWRQRDAWL